MPELPLLLAGPIIRKAERDGVWIWIATRDEVTNVTPSLTAYTKTGKPDGAHGKQGAIVLAALDGRRFRCLRLGERLWITLFRMSPAKGTLPGELILGYDFSLETAAGTFPLSGLVHQFDRTLCYSPFPAPTFYLQSKDGNLAHGSCRRPGAHGPDAYVRFDSWLSEAPDAVDKRPAALFLTGDQIYADDVAYSLFHCIRLLAEDAMGYDEFLPQVMYLGRRRPFAAAGHVKYTVDANDKHTRRAECLNASLTTQDGEGHLMSFGEFAAMYLLVWNPELCELYKLEDDLRAPAGGNHNLKDFTKAVAAARRVMANIPCYMSFDDHEVTDDWNADIKWVRALENPLGRRILSNALASYWAFQGWGNDPALEGATGHLPQEIPARLDKLRTTAGQAADEAFEKDILAYGPWSYVAPTLPPVVVVDLRTQRQFVPENLDIDNLDDAPPSSLLNEKGYKHLEQICRKWRTHQPLVLLLPTPLLPWEPLMIVRRNAIGIAALHRGFRYLDEYEFGDLWEDHRDGRGLFIEWLRDTFKPSYVVVFSGDVHHGSVVRGTCRLQPSRDDRHELWSLDILQITSSAIKNEPHKLRDTLIGIPMQEILEILTDTEGSSYATSREGRWLSIEYDAVSMPSLGFHDTMISANHLCVVDFRSRQVVVEFLNAGQTLKAVMPV